MMQNPSANSFVCLTGCSFVGAREECISEMRIFSRKLYCSISIKIEEVAKFSMSSAFNCHGKKQRETIFPSGASCTFLDFRDQLTTEHVHLP